MIYSDLKHVFVFQVAKNRYSGDLGVMALDFDKKSLSYAQKKPKDKPNPPPIEVPSTDSSLVSGDSNRSDLES